MPDLLAGTDTNVIGAPATIFIAPVSYATPTQISQVVNLSTYVPNSSYGFLKVGYTETQIQLAREAATREIRTSQQGLFKTLPTDYKSTITTRALETTQQNKQILQQASIAAANAAGERVTYFEASPFLTFWHLAVIWQDEYLKFHVSYFDRTQWDGRAQNEVFDRATEHAIDISFVAYPSSNLIGPNGFHAERVDFDQ